MANDDQNQQGGDTSSKEQQQDATQQSQQGGSGNDSQEPGQDQGTSASIQQDTTTSSGAPSSTDSKLAAAIGEQNQQVVETVKPAEAPAGEIVKPAEGADSAKDTSNEDSSNGQGGADAADKPADQTGGEQQDTGDGQGAAQGDQGQSEAADKPVAPAPEPEAAPAAQPAQPAPASQVSDPVSLNPVSDLLNQNLLKKEPSFKASIVLDNLKLYMEGMKAGKPVSQTEQLKHQRNLFALITTTINDLEDDEFRPVFTTLCKAFADDVTGCFADTHVYRAWGNLSMTTKQRTAFEYLVKLLMTLAPTKGREVAKNHINVEIALKNGINERGRHRLIDFFGIK